MNDEIIAFLRSAAQGVSSQVIAERFLKFNTPNKTMVHKAVQAILAKDKRCHLGEDMVWHAAGKNKKDESRTLNSIPWAAISLLARGQHLYHLSIWSVFPRPRHVFSQWLHDPARLPPEEQLLLQNTLDPPFDSMKSRSVFLEIPAILGESVPVFAAMRDHALLAMNCAAEGGAFPEDAMLISRFFRAAGRTMPRPLCIEECHRALFPCGAHSPAAIEQGRLLAECIMELVDNLGREGIETRDDLQNKEDEEISSFDFSDKAFTFEDIKRLPHKPGVYGFKDRNDRHIYIGKAADLRRRVSGYFRKADESPAKLEKLLRDCFSLTTHICGSELECLIYEYRLINKYAPVLNSQVTINERKGNWKTFPDSIILLPHAREGMGMSVWFRQNQKIRLRPFAVAFREKAAMTAEIHEFFFTPTLPATSRDFPEQEIAFRWIGQRLDSLLIVPVSRLGSAEEIIHAVMSYWRETQ